MDRPSSQALITNTYNSQQASIEVAGLKTPLQVNKIQCHSYGLHQDYEFNLSIYSPQVLNLDAYLGNHLCLTWQTNQQPQYIHGVLQQEICLGKNNHGYIYQISLVAPLHQLQHQQKQQIYLQKNPIEIVKEILLNAGIGHHQLQIHCQQKYPTLPYVVKYHESDADFMQRLLAHWGMLLWYEQQSHGFCIHITDSTKQLPAIQASLKHIPLSGQNSEQCIYFLCPQQHWHEQNIQLEEQNPQQPDTLLTASGKTNKANKNTGKTLRLAGLHQTTLEQAKHLVAARQHQLDWQREIFIAMTNARGLIPGQLLKISNNPNQTLNQTYRILNINYEFEQPVGNPDSIHKKAKAWQCQLILIPSKTAFKLLSHDVARGNHLAIKSLEKCPKKPAFLGILPAKTESIYTKNRYAYLTQDGRYHLRTALDTSNTAVGQASHPIMKLQHFGGQGGKAPGNNYGLHHPTQPNQISALIFRDGDIGRPAIFANFHNPINPSPVMSGNEYSHCFATATGHKLYMHDLLGKESIQWQTPQALNCIKLLAHQQQHAISLESKTGSHIHSAQKDISLKAKSNQQMTIKNSHSTQVTGQQTLIVKKQHHTIQSGNAIDYQSQQKQQWKNDTKNAQLSTPSFSQFKAKKNVSLVAKQNNVQYHLNKGKTIHYAKSMKVFSAGQGNFLIGDSQNFINATVAKACVAIQQDILIEAPTINIYNTSLHNSGFKGSDFNDD